MTSEPDSTALPDDEHQRFQQYLQALSTASGADEPELIGMILLDPDTAMAQSAVLRHLEERAPRFLEPTAERFDAWARGLAEVVGPFPYLRQRLAEWALLRRLAAGEPGSPDDLVTASDWCQRAAANTTIPSAALLVLAEHGRTRRVRAAARDRLASRPHRP